MSDSPNGGGMLHSSAVDSLTCQWAACGERCESPEALYDHVCERHVGRKSTNNLNLQCQWGNCRTTTVKRDHITSHIRVHVPLKPHKCDFCGKSFKRPQDLKKHVKTHADESVLLNSPQPGTAQRTPVTANGFQQSNPKQGYYNGHMAQAAAYGYGPTSNGHPGYGGGGAPIPSYGPVYYNMPQTAGFAGGDFGSRKRGHDALNEWLGDAKRGRIDPGHYQDLNSRFGGVQSLGIPVQSGYGNNMFSAGPLYDSQGDTAVAYQTAPFGPFGQPFPELRTKNDLLSIDQFLEQLQNTVYEHPIGTPPTTLVGNGFDGNTYASTNSPAQSSVHTATSSHAGDTPGDSISYTPPSMDEVPGLTPSTMHAGQSPASVSSSTHNRSPSSRPASNALYPQLPSFSTLSDSSSDTYSANASPGGIPPSSLGNAYEDFDGRRRYSGGYLHAARRSPPYGDSSRPGSADKKADGAKTASPTKLPSIADITRRDSPPAREQKRAGTSSPTSTPAEERQEAWVQNIRIVEALREYIKTRLNRGEYSPGSNDEGSDGQRTPRAAPVDADGDHEMGGTKASPSSKEEEEEKKEKSGSLYPILRPVEA